MPHCPMNYKALRIIGLYRACWSSQSASDEDGSRGAVAPSATLYTSIVVAASHLCCDCSSPALCVSFPTFRAALICVSRLHVLIRHTPLSQGSLIILQRTCLYAIESASYQLHVFWCYWIRDFKLVSFSLSACRVCSLPLTR
jgi:hypothetical protein